MPFKNLAKAVFFLKKIKIHAHLQAGDHKADSGQQFLKMLCNI